MDTVRSVVDYIQSKIGYKIRKVYYSKTSNSAYLYLKKTSLGVIRVSDHCGSIGYGRSKRFMRWQVRIGLDCNVFRTSKVNFYSENAVDLLIQEIKEYK